MSPPHISSAGWSRNAGSARLRRKDCAAFSRKVLAPTRAKPMRNLWADRDARAAVKSYRRQGVNEDLALRTYTSRLLGGDPRLVQHGGGNTSVTNVMRDPAGES